MLTHTNSPSQTIFAGTNSAWRELDDLFQKTLRRHSVHAKLQIDGRMAEFDSLTWVHASQSWAGLPTLEGHLPSSSAVMRQRSLAQVLMAISCNGAYIIGQGGLLLVCFSFPIWYVLLNVFLLVNHDATWCMDHCFSAHVEPLAAPHCRGMIIGALCNCVPMGMAISFLHHLKRIIGLLCTRLITLQVVSCRQCSIIRLRFLI